jgi:L-alanine-DL-glutamate epimerase-like enolase superfamily enzyme
MSSYARLAELPLEIELYELEGLERELSKEFTRYTTLVKLRGGGEEGIGEDVTYEGLDHVALRDAGPTLPLAGSHTLDSFSRRLDELDLFPAPPVREPSRHYRRWAFESAALDLALRQAGQSLAGALGREARPVTYVVSLRIGEPPSVDPIRRLLANYPGMRFKLDPTNSWDEALISELASSAEVDTLDLKGFYRGTPVDVETDPVLYRQVAEAFPNAWIEDPDLTDATEPVLGPHRHRITWDAPIHSVADIEALPFPPRTINVKPSRFGSVRALCEAYDYCADGGISVYGGGQGELGVGRGHIQYLASVFHPDTPNDVAPGEFNSPDPPPDLPRSPLEPTPAKTGFRWGD